MIGSVIRMKVRRGFAPRFAAASSRLRSIVRRLAETLTTTNGSASAVWARTSPTSDPLIRHWTNSENIPIAMITTGTISGEDEPVHQRPPGKRPRLRPSAASVPRTVARIAVRTRDLALFTMPVDHCRSVNIRSYHWSEKPSGGKLRIRASVKLIGTMTSVGASR